MNAQTEQVAVLICAPTPLGPSHVPAGMATHCQMIRERAKVFSNIVL